MLKNFKILLPIVVASALVMSTATTIFAWEKDSGADCEQVFASIKNLTEVRNWDGYVKANGVDVVVVSGVVQPHDWVSISWTPTPGFTGSVEAYVRVLYPHGVTDDFTQIIDQIDCSGDDECDQEISCNTGGGDPSPSPSPSPEASASATPNTGGGDSNSGSGSGSNSDNNLSNSSPSDPQVLGETGSLSLFLATGGFGMVLLGLWQIKDKSLKSND